jgi:hypothetical protein
MGAARGRALPVRAIAALVAALAAAGARADEGDRRVVLIVANIPRAKVDEIETRVRGELQAAGFELAETYGPAGPTWRSSVEAAARSSGLPTIGIADFDDLVEIEICRVERGTPAVIGQRLSLASVPRPRRAAVLAVMAVDLLRTTRATPPAPVAPAPNPPAISAPATQPPETPVVSAPAASAVAVRPAPPPRPLPHRPTVTLGGGWLGAGAASGFIPFASATVLGRRLGGRATVGAWGVTPEVSADAGRAHLGHALALGELVVAVPLGRSVDLLASAGGGAWRLSVDGTGAAGFRGNSTASWSAVGGAGAGLAWAISPRLALAIDGRVLAATTATTVRIGGDEVARAGRPLAWITAGLGLRL